MTPRWWRTFISFWVRRTKRSSCLGNGFVERDGFLAGLKTAEFNSLHGNSRLDGLGRRVGLPRRREDFEEIEVQSD
jgi:hypothetical protein